MGQFKVIIVGGGLAGSLLANGLVNNGVDTIVYERDAENTKREGYQIRLGNAALNGLAACLTDLHMASVLQKLGQSSGSSTTAPCLCNTKFETVLDLTALPTYSKSSAINRVVLRDLLLSPISTAGRVKFGKCFSHYEIVTTGPKNESEIVKVFFTDGSSDVCDILVAADGSGSKINKQIGANNLVDIKSHLSFLAKGSVTKERLLQLPSRLQKGPILVFKNGISLFYALYLPAPQTMNGTQKHDSKLDFDESQASFYWGLSVPQELCPFSNYNDIPDRRQFCLDIVRDWAPEYHTMLSVGDGDKDSNSIYVTMLRASTKLSKQWRQHLQAQKDKTPEKGHSRVWLVGDAVHAMQPNRGMGGNQAMQDIADMLPEILKLKESAEAGSAPTDEEIQARCSAYEKKMIDRAFVWVTKSGGTSMPMDS
ncbi:fungal specific transcription factor [Fusarium longipes]|uniref:Fungal specific transcription factor n=1 Tax=Fusarium longipes TaxID=694270 RepID=A0A395TA44_9HYPO|nr:fungal specific transcription factor [Fusarium longipes]